MIVHKVGGCYDIERCLSGIGNAPRLNPGPYVTIGLYLNAALSRQTGLDAFLFHTFDNTRQFLDRLVLALQNHSRFRI